MMNIHKSIWMFAFVTIAGIFLYPPLRAQSADTAAPPQNQGLGQTDRLLIPVTPFSESDWHVAFNTQKTKGRMEVRLSDSRIDILTKDYAIEVDRVSKYLEGINQALRYAEASGRKPGLALYIDGDPDALELLIKAKSLCEESKIRFWFINEYVSINDLVRQKGVAAPSLVDSPVHTNVDPGVTDQKQPAVKSHWISPSGVRHNRSCRWYANTRNGKHCAPSAGRACKQCGG